MTLQFIRLREQFVSVHGCFREGVVRGRLIEGLRAAGGDKEDDNPENADSAEQIEHGRPA